MTPTDPMLLAFLGGAALGVVLLFALRRRAKRRPKVLVDGSNVMYWKDESPSIDTLREVISALKNAGFRPGVMFDANAGHLLVGRYLHHEALSQKLGLPESQVMVVPKGTPADPFILQAARDLGGRVVTNDRYRDWVETFPEVATPGHLIPGGYRNGKLWFAFDTPAANEKRRPERRRSSQ